MQCNSIVTISLFINNNDILIIRYDVTLREQNNSITKMINQFINQL